MRDVLGRAVFVVACVIALLSGSTAIGGVARAAQDDNVIAGHPPMSNRDQAGVNTPASPDRYLALDYTIDRSDLPALYYNELTLLINVGLAEDVEVTSGGQAIAYEYDPFSGQLMVTTGGDDLHLVVKNPQSEAGLGTFQKAPLKYNKKWAWSHGLDDNTFLGPSIQAFRDRDWQATLFMIGQNIDDQRNESWIVDAGLLKQLVKEGWSLGNHTWDHACQAPGVNQETVVDGYNRLKEIVQSSDVPGYRPISFAAPCFAAEYRPIVQNLVASGLTDTLYNESGNDYRLVVDAGAGTYTNGERRAYPFSSTRDIGRDPTIESNPSQVQQEMDWMAANTSENRHFWYNTLSHGNKEASLEQVIDYVYAHYGPGGTDEVLVAPSDEIYSYLLVRDRSTVTFQGLTPVSVDPSPGGTYALNYTIDRSAVPDLNYQDLTLLIHVGQVDSVHVTGNNVVEYNYDADSGVVMVTTPASRIQLLVTHPSDLDNLGTFEKAVLKGDKAWAWSHSMDDNGNLRQAIDVMRQYGWQGTLYLVGDWIVAPSMTGYLLNEDELRQLLVEGWALGNHTQDHQCDPALITSAGVIEGQDTLRALIDSSSMPQYKISSFAAPCMEPTYNELFQDLVVSGQTEALFNEADKRDDGYHNYYRLVVDPHTAFPEDWRTTAFTTTIPIGRNFDFELDEPGKGPEMVNAHLDEIANLVGPELHFWYNTASHGNGEEKLETVASHVYQTYGPGGSDEVWVAPAEQIYSYLLVRDNSIVTFEGMKTATPGAVRQLLPIAIHP